MKDNFSTSTLVLTGNSVSLIPLQLMHRDELLSLSVKHNMSSLWFTGIPDETSIDEYINRALAEKADNKSLPFVVVANNTQTVLGCTRVCHADFNNRRFEIGYTWYGKEFQRTSVNTECKLMLLTYLFEIQQAIAVEFKTHWHNQKSRTAIARLGAKQDGVLRNHQLHPDGEKRDTVVFSIIDNEWPTVKKSLNYRLQQNSQ